MYWYRHVIYIVIITFKSFIWVLVTVPSAQPTELVRLSTSYRWGMPLLIRQ